MTFNINKTNKYILIFCIIFISLFSLGIGKASRLKADKIYKNIFIGNIDVGGLNKEDAISKLSNKYPLKVINLTYDNIEWQLDPIKIEYNYNIDKFVNEAITYTKTNSKIENIKRKISLQTNNKYNIKFYASYNESKLSEIIENISNQIDVKVKNASIEIKDTGEIIKNDSKEGIEVDIVKLKEEIYSIFINKQFKNINIPIKKIKPKIKTDDINEIDTVLGQFSTSFNDNNSRGSNIHVAGQSTSDKIIMPLEEFSYNYTTGARTWSNGYKTAKVIIGNKFVNGEGGGVCQVSTTMYNAALLSGMKITEAHNHTFISRYASKGRDAAVSYGYKDFKFKNPYSHPIYIKNIVGKGSITTKIYGHKQYKQNIQIRCESKYDKDKIIVKTFRIYYDEEGNKINEELITNSIYKLK